MSLGVRGGGTAGQGFFRQSSTEKLELLPFKKKLRNTRLQGQGQEQE